jgi:hypothetical protein
MQAGPNLGSTVPPGQGTGTSYFEARDNNIAPDSFREGPQLKPRLNIRISTTLQGQIKREVKGENKERCGETTFSRPGQTVKM